MNDDLLRRIASVLAAHPTASMAEVARSLGIGRTTLYRRFSDREAMTREVAAQAGADFVRAVVAADPGRGRGFDALARIARALFDLPDVLTLLFADTPLLTDPVLEAAYGRVIADSGEKANPHAIPAEMLETDNDLIAAVVLRGRGDGSIRDVPVAWAAMFVYFTLGSAHLYATGTGASRSAALDLALEAFDRTLGVAG
ncbi:TetR/AcrR family transcriptional regulator [Brevibacterium samyangense]|uniref:HTH tetR-type domain-containing protein n=1 Tax=Brevibacterium samyangense TaxID=366888 RepID=A0ABN2T806_9MICO